ncbi:hypothetical protein L7F22_027368 [Adiantum nelumboides]|nr:hypothetical protein [Adiantum nelumboides]
MDLFGLREDYCISIVAYHLQEDSNIIDAANDKYSIMDALVGTGEFAESVEALAMAYKDVAQSQSSRQYKKGLYSLDFSREQTIHSSEATDFTRFRSSITTPLCVEKQGGHVGSSGSPCELLYRADILPNQEDELLTELVSLLNLDTPSPSAKSCHSFRFPKSLDELTDACTPKMKADVRNFSAEVPSVSAEKRTEESHCSSLMCVESTPLAIKQALLSPLLEKEIMAELAKLFPLCKETSQEGAPSPSLSLTRSDQSVKTEDTKVSMPQEQLGKDGSIIRRLMFNAAGVQADGNAAVTSVSGLKSLATLHLCSLG